ncbi:unnamed protein product [Orchesella dallaii]|uniref:Insulin-degrading enzyme n=1 Tax=Orchesella dallaii TaxID=48710 RepID=A0ABP1REV9_9HEXA
MERLHPLKSPNDPKNYLALVLENGLQLLLVSDNECDKAAVSLSVGVGSMTDPDDIPGLAHLCEHLLSKEVNDSPGHKPFSSIIAENGGMFNAFTARDQTNFHFDIDPLVFSEAVERFTNFFLQTPTLSEKVVEKEINIIDAEHLSKENKDAWRKMAVEASTSKKDHPHFKFSTGNKATLSDIPKQKGINVQKAAHDFRSKYYVSRLMNVAVYARSTLENLEKLCAPLFSKIPDNKNAKLPQWNEWPYGTNELGRQFDIVSLADIRDFYIVFPIENTRPFYKTFPHGYLTRLIGNKGLGSLHSYLYEKQWVENSYISTSIPGRGYGELSIGFQLTKEGLNYMDEIALHTFQYIKMMKDNGPQLYFWKEMQEILCLQFLYQDREIPVDFVQRITNLMHVYPLLDVLSIGYIVTDFEPVLIEKYLGYLHPRNSRIISVCRRNGERREEFCQDHWYGAKYSVKVFTEEQIKKWETCQALDSFYLPVKNKFIPTNFALKRNGKTIVNTRLSWSPTLLHDTPLHKAWFLEDNEFETAKGVVRLEIFSPLPMFDPLSQNLNQVWFLMLKNLLSEEFYQASVAGCYNEIKPTLYGVEVSVSGYSHKLLILMEEVFLRIIQSLDSPSNTKHFAAVKDRYASGLSNFKNLLPHNIATYYLSLILREKRFSYEELLEAIADTSEENWSHYVTSFFFRSHFEWFIYGNFTRTETESFLKSCMHHIEKRWNTRPLLPSQLPRLREICIPSGTQYAFKEVTSQLGNACAVFMQTGILTIKESMILEIIDQIIYEPLFTQLRNNEQIGYIVRSSVRRSNGCQGLLIFVQGNKDPTLMSERIHFVMDKIGKMVENMQETEFNQHKNAVRVRKSERPRHMLALLNKLWDNEIFTRRYDFGRIERELKVLDLLRHDELIPFYKKYFSEILALRKIIEVHLRSDRKSESTTLGDSEESVRTKDGSRKVVAITDIDKWKAEQCLYSVIEVK